MQLRCVFYIFLVFLTLPLGAIGQEVVPKKITIVDGTEFHYVSHGEGEAVIFIHGLMDDASVWSRQQQEFAREGYRAIAYSRRHNYPNKNPVRSNHSASLEADDLAALVRQLKLKEANVVGFSYGAYTALFFALKYPDLAQTVTLIEPPIAPWLSDLPANDSAAGRSHFARLMEQGVGPATVAIKSGDKVTAIRAMVDAIGGKGKFESLPQFVKEKCKRNIKELEAFLASKDRFPAVDRKDVQGMAVPTLLLSGGKSLATAKFTDPELERLIPDKFRKRIIFEEATHVLWIEEPVRFRTTVLKFLRETPRSGIDQ